MGFRVPQGGTRTIDIGYSSDAPAPDWTVSVNVPAQLYDTSGNPFDNGQVRASLDTTTGHNGTRARLTVTVDQASTIGAEYVELDIRRAERRVVRLLVAARARLTKRRGSATSRAEPCVRSRSLPFASASARQVATGPVYVDPW